MRITPGEGLISWRDISYRVIRQLGSSGGTSTVFLTLATSGIYKGVTCAVKVFHKLDLEEWRMNFMREVHFLRSCAHPAIMTVLDEGIYTRDSKTSPFMVMEYLPQTLDQALGALSELEKISCITQLLSAINYLSHLDPPIVHRDIKPKNIFLKADRCVLGDFGLLFRVGNVPHLSASRGRGTTVPPFAINYRSPELASYHRGGSEPSSKSDIFQLGLVAAEMFTGRNPLMPGRITDFDFQTVEAHGTFGFVVNTLIGKMLKLEASERPAALDALREWQELYLSAVLPSSKGQTVVATGSE